MLPKNQIVHAYTGPQMFNIKKNISHILSASSISSLVFTFLPSGQKQIKAYTPIKVVKTVFFSPYTMVGGPRLTRYKRRVRDEKVVTSWMYNWVSLHCQIICEHSVASNIQYTDFLCIFGCVLCCEYIPIYSHK